MNALCPHVEFSSAEHVRYSQEHSTCSPNVLSNSFASEHAHSCRAVMIMSVPHQSMCNCVAFVQVPLEAEQEVKACSVRNIELSLKRLYVVRISQDTMAIGLNFIYVVHS